MQEFRPFPLLDQDRFGGEGLNQGAFQKPVELLRTQPLKV
jgi:hypothetical protein